MTTPQIVGLYGPSRAGKDETAAILVSDFGYEKRAQAAAIRKILLGLNALVTTNAGTSLPMKDLFEVCNENWDEVKAMSTDSVDQMIRLGQTCRDVLGIDVWLNTAFPPPCTCLVETAIGGQKTLGCKCTKVVISDIRQENEYNAVKARGGEVWKIIRPGVEKRGMDGLLDHLSFDATLYNNGTLQDLRGMVQANIATNMRNKEIKGSGNYGTGNYGTRF
jgi:hypothetical protein